MNSSRGSSKRAYIRTSNLIRVTIQISSSSPSNSSNSNSSSKGDSEPNCTNSTITNSSSNSNSSNSNKHPPYKYSTALTPKICLPRPKLHTSATFIITVLLLWTQQHEKKELWNQPPLWALSKL